jgi:hypothetical protein
LINYSVGEYPLFFDELLRCGGELRNGETVTGGRAGP